MSKVSIITINFNNSKGLERTFKSVFEQTFQNFEYIVIDGQSIDGSKDLIKANSNKIAYWISEKDHGVYQAMNKGIQQASGEYVLFLNSGDHFTHERILEQTSKELDGTGIVYGNIFLIKLPG